MSTRSSLPCPSPDDVDLAPQLIVVALADAALLAVDRALDCAHPVLAAPKRPFLITTERFAAHVLDLTAELADRLRDYADAVQRLKQSGMRWGVPGAQAILSPRGWTKVSASRRHGPSSPRPFTPTSPCSRTALRSRRKVRRRNRGRGRHEELHTEHTLAIGRNVGRRR
jgi:hypothetical protein